MRKLALNLPLKSYKLLGPHVLSTMSWPPLFTAQSSSVPIHLPYELTHETLHSFAPFKKWLGTLEYSLSLQAQESHPFHKTPYKLRYIDIQSVDIFGGNRVGFIKLKASISNDSGEKLPGSVFLRGGSVAMLASRLTPEDAAHR